MNSILANTPEISENGMYSSNKLNVKYENYMKKYDH